MIMSPLSLHSKTPGEAVYVYLQLKPAIGSDTVSTTPQFTSDPPDLLFSMQGTTDAGQTATALVSGGIAGVNYTLSATCIMASGQILQPVVVLPVVAAKVETQPAPTWTVNVPAAGLVTTR